MKMMIESETDKKIFEVKSQMTEISRNYEKKIQEKDDKNQKVMKEIVDKYTSQIKQKDSEINLLKNKLNSQIDEIQQTLESNLTQN